MYGYVHNFVMILGSGILNISIMQHIHENLEIIFLKFALLLLV